MYCELRDNVFSIHDIEICIKATVRRLPTKQRVSALKWACHAGNGTYKSRLACSVAVYSYSLIQYFSYCTGVQYEGGFNKRITKIIV